MADNVTLNSGTGGATLAADDISGVHHQRVKIQVGADGSATDVSDANPLPIDDAGGSITVDGAVTVSGTVTADLGATDNAVLDSIAANTGAGALESGGNLATLAGAVSGAEMQADVVTLPPIVVDSGNSTTTPLTGSATFTGTGVDLLNYQGVTISLFADQDSAANGMRFEFSTDNSNWDLSHQHDYVADTGREFQFAAQARYFRVVFVNDSSAQSAVRIQTLLHRSVPAWTVHRMDSDLAVDRSAIAVKAGLMAQVSGSGSFTPVASNAQGKLQVAAEIDDGGNSITVDIGTALPAGTNNIGDVDVATVAAGSNLIGDVGISGARTSGGTTLYKNIDVDESEDQVKGSAGQVYWIHAVNLSSAVKYLKLYNATAASVTVGTTTPDLTFPLPTQGDTNGAGFVLSIPNGIAFSTAITIAATTGVADNDSGAPGANEVICNLGYA